MSEKMAGGKVSGWGTVQSSAGVGRGADKRQIVKVLRGSWSEIGRKDKKCGGKNSGGVLVQKSEIRSAQVSAPTFSRSEI